MKSASPDYRLKVKLDGETQDVSFEQPVQSVEFSNGKCQRPHLPGYKFFLGGMVGASATMLLAWLYFTTSNLKVVAAERVIVLQDDPKDDDRHVWIKTGRHQVARTLRAHGIMWDADLKIWVESIAPSVTTLSPKHQNPDK